MDKEYFAKYRREHYVSNTTTRDMKNHEVLGKLLLNLVGCSKRDAGTVVSAKETGYTYDSFSESDMLVINQQALATNLNVSQMTISRLLTKANELGYVRFCDTYTLKDAKHASDVYFICIDKIMEDFADLDLNVDSLASNYYNNLHDKEEGLSAKIKINNNCMKQSVWKDLKVMIEEANKELPEEFRVKFLNQHEDGNHYDSRYFTCLCNTENPERHEDSDRYAKINKLFGTDAKLVEIDVNSMMYRTSYDLIHDKYLDKDADVYYELYKYMTTDPMSLLVFKKDARQFIKKELMSIYMDPRSVYCKCTTKSNGLNAKQEEYNRNMILTLFGMEYEEFLNRLKEALYQFLSVYDFECDKRIFFGRMFFKYEAIVYYYMNQIFKSKGIKSANVYDGFYFIEGTCDKNLFYEVYHEAIDKTKEFLANHNHDLVKLYGKTYTLKYKIYKKVESKKTERQKGTYDIPTTKVVTVSESAEEHSKKQDDYVQSVIAKCKELEASGKRAFY
jgi:hypothetical protein